MRKALVGAVAGVIMLASTPAQADMAKYNKIIHCAAYHELVAAVLTTDDAKAHKKEIKAQEASLKSFMELAHVLLDPANVPYDRIQADTKEAYLDYVQELRDGKSIDRLLSELSAQCDHGLD